PPWRRGGGRERGSMACFMRETVSGPTRPGFAPPLWSVSMEDWTIMREIVAAVRRPDAAGAPPGVVLEHVLSALRQADAKLVVPSNCPETNGRSYRRPDSFIGYGQFNGPHQPS